MNCEEKIQMFSSSEFTEFFWDKKYLLKDFKFINQKLPELFLEKNKIYFILFVCELPISMVVLQEDYDFSIRTKRYDNKRVFIIDYIVVKEDYQNQGFSKKVIETMFMWAAQKSYDFWINSFTREGYSKLSKYIKFRSQRSGVKIYGNSII